MGKSKIATPKTNPNNTQAQDCDNASSCEPLMIEGYDVSFPNDGFDTTFQEKLKSIIKLKEALIKKVFNTDDLHFDVTDDKIVFPWIKGQATPDEIHAYETFLSKLIGFIRLTKRVNCKNKEKENPSEKFAFRCFLLRLGFIGKEYSTDRKILLAPLSGSSSFRRTKANA